MSSSLEKFARDSGNLNNILLGTWLVASPREDWNEDRTEDFLTNYRTIVAETRARHNELKQDISEAFLEKIEDGMQYWVDGGEAGHMVWGSFHFVKPD